jgi:hypothetical protein
LFAVHAMFRYQNRYIYNEGKQLSQEGKKNKKGDAQQKIRNKKCIKIE